MVMTAEERKESVRVRSAKYKAENKEKIALANKRYRENNKAKIAANGAKWAAANRDKVNAINAKYRKNNKDRLAIMYKKYNEVHKENKAKWVVANRDKVNASKSKYVNNNKDKVNVLSANRRAKKFGATIYMTKEDKAKIAELYTIAKDATKLFGYGWEVDHIVPLAKGGLHKLSNLQVVPMSWNRVKSDKNCDTYWD